MSAEAEPVCTNVPASHVLVVVCGEHGPEPESDLNIPAAHVVQVASSAFAVPGVMRWPAGQAVSEYDMHPSLLCIGEYFPAAQSTHEASSFVLEPKM